MSKGVAMTIGTVVFMIFLVTVAVLFISIAFGEFFKIEKIVLGSAEISRAKNTFYTLNTSLSETWRVSAIQAIFQTGEESVGCGIDDARIARKYWLLSDSNAEKSNRREDVVGSGVFPQGASKYGALGKNPVTCAPQMLHLKAYLEEKMEPYTKLPERITVNNMNVRITNPSADFEHPSPENLFVKSLASERVDISASGDCARDRTCITAFQNHESAISTELPNMVFVSRSLVRRLFEFSAQFISTIIEGGREVVNPLYRNDLRYRDIDATNPTQNKDEYAEGLKTMIAQIIREHEQFLKKSDIITKIAADYYVPSGAPDFSGTKVLYRYRIDFKVTEKFVGAAEQCAPPDSAVLDIINNEIPFDGWDISGAKFSREEIVGVISAIINTESAWQQYAVSTCGAAGYMQLMPLTARALGIQNIYALDKYVEERNAKDKECATDYGKTLRQFVLNSRDPVAGDGRLDAQQNIRAGVAHFKSLLEFFYAKTEDKDKALTLAIAAYNGGTDAVDKAADNAKDFGYEWTRVKVFLLQETADYVPKVLSCSPFYNGPSVAIAGAAALKWPAESKQVSSCFGEPRLRRGGGYRQHAGIDIADSVGKNVFAAYEGDVISTFEDADIPGAGKWIALIHNINGRIFYTRYLHLDGFLVRNGEHVVAGQSIGTLGATGMINPAPHLHFEITYDWTNSNYDNALNPCVYLGCETRCPDSQPRGAGAEELPVSFAALSDNYYRHDEARNEFAPKPITLEYIVDDYVTAIDCRTGNALYKWDDDESPDVACFNGCVFTCGVDIPGLKESVCDGLSGEQRNVGNSGVIGGYQCESSYVPPPPPEKQTWSCSDPLTTACTTDPSTGKAKRYGNDKCDEECPALRCVITATCPNK